MKARQSGIPANSYLFCSHLARGLKGLIPLHFPLLFQFCARRNVPVGLTTGQAMPPKATIRRGRLPAADADTNVAPNLEE
jgi:hypothetical protein